MDSRQPNVDSGTESKAMYDTKAMYDISNRTFVRDAITGKVYRLTELLSEGVQTDANEPGSIASGGSDKAPSPGRPTATPSESDPMAEAFDRVLERLKVLASRKGRDYGTDEDSTANLRASEDFGIPAWVGCVSRGNDKMKRLQSFVKTGKLHNEPVDDALEDLAVYTIWAIVFRNEETYPPGKVTNFG